MRILFIMTLIIVGCGKPIKETKKKVPVIVGNRCDAYGTYCEEYDMYSGRVLRCYYVEYNNHKRYVPCAY